MQGLDTLRRINAAGYVPVKDDRVTDRELLERLFDNQMGILSLLSLILDPSKSHEAQLLAGVEGSMKLNMALAERLFK